MNRYVPVSPVFNDHLEAIEHHFGSLRRGFPVRRDIKFVFVCFTNRCGSNFVASAISSDGYLNRAGEFFNQDTVIGNSVESGLRTLSGFIDWLIDREGKNGWLVSKLAVPHLEVLSKSGIIDSIIDRSFFIMVERSDKLAQSISYDIALQTGKWVYSDQNPLETELEFSQERLATVIESIIDQNREFSRFFGLNAIKHLLINYEEFESDPNHYLKSIARYIGIADLRYFEEKIDVKTQRSEINHKWRHMYIDCSKFTRQN